jgi:hypothetical protein
MKIAIAYTKYWEPLARIFYNTIPEDDYELYALYLPLYKSEIKTFGEEYSDIATKQYELFIQLIKQTPHNDVACMLDTDIQFFKPFVNKMKECLGSYDFGFNYELFCPLNAGIFLARNNSTTLDFLHTFINDWMKTGRAYRKSPIIAALLQQNNIPFMTLPKPFFNYSFDQPEADIILHHSFGGLTLENKIDDLIDLRTVVGADMTPIISAIGDIKTNRTEIYKAHLRGEEPID